MPNDVVCPVCAAANPPGFRFCGSCGASVDVSCPVCGTTNPPGFRFCGACGSAMAPQPQPSVVETPQERKVITALFADLVASTEMASRLDPEDLRRVLAPFFDAMVEEIDRTGGTVEKFIGDAIVAVFGVPAAHEDDPERAVRAALAMQGRLRELNADAVASGAAPLSMRIGVFTGEVFAHGVGGSEGLVTGDTMSLAARLQTLADPGSVVVGERTWRDTRDRFAYRPLGEVRVKGVDRPLAAWVAQGLAPERVSRERRMPFIGRGGELELLRVLFDRAVREDRPILATIVGPPGIGKSRLAQEIATTLGEVDGVRIVQGRCLPYGEGLTYWPMAEILKADAGILDSDIPNVILQKARARLDPRFAGDEAELGLTSVLLSSIGVSVPSDPLAGAEPEAAQRMVARAWQRYLESMTREGPVVALIEDIHWADPRLLDLLETVLGRAAGAAFVLCLTRPDLFERRPSWSGGLSDATTLSLSPLSADEATELLEHLFGDAAPPDVVAPILDRSEGNPFFAGELLRMITEDGTLERRDGRWTLVRAMPATLPDTVQGVIASRIDLLSTPEKRVIQDAAVVGRIFWPGSVARLGGGDVDTALGSLVEKGLVWERDGSSIDGERELIFHHILTRDVAYGSIPRARRAEAHAAVGAWIEEATHGRDEEFAEILAYHFERAGDLPKMARSAMLAGDRHRRVFAAEDAIRWYDRAVVAAQEVEDLAVLAEASISRGEALEQLGRFVDAHADYERALETARSAEPEDRRLEARSLAAIAHVLWNQDRYAEGERLLPEALRAARGADLPFLESRLLYTAGTIAFGRGDWERSLSFHEEALAVASRHDDRQGEAYARHGLTETRYFIGPYDEGLREGLEADRLLRELGQRPMVFHNGYMVGVIHLVLGRPDDADVAMQESVTGCREVGNRRDLGFALSNLALARMTRGRLGPALEIGDEAVAVASEVDAPRLEITARIYRMFVLAELYELDRLDADLASANRFHERVGGAFFRPWLLAFRGWRELRAGDARAAGASFREAQEGSALTDRVFAGRIEIVAREHGSDPEPLRSAAEQMYRDGLVAPIALPWGRYGLGRAAALAGGWSEALVAARQALEESEAAGDVMVGLRAAGLVAEALSVLGHPGAADAGREARARIDGVAGTIEDEGLRASFLARPDLARVLGG